MLARTVSGGVTINDCLFHFAQINQPMGGVGASGTGAYHGQWGFDTLSKLKPVFYRSPFNRLADLYPPYGAKIARMEKLLRFLSLPRAVVILRCAPLRASKDDKGARGPSFETPLRGSSG